MYFFFKYSIFGQSDAVVFSIFIKRPETDMKQNLNLNISVPAARNYHYQALSN